MVPNRFILSINHTVTIPALLHGLHCICCDVSIVTSLSLCHVFISALYVCAIGLEVLRAWL